MEDLLPFEIPSNKSSIIKVIGVGGGGSNAVNHMFKQGIKGVDFIVCNTDAQALAKSPVEKRIQLGITLTEGLGAGNRPECGRESAVESLELLQIELQNNTKMVFITAGMGGGTGTGAAPVIAALAKELGILTVGIVTIPFRYEGKKRINQAIEGIKEMSKYVDSLLIVNNEKIREMYGDLNAAIAFGMADDVLTVAAKGIAEIITKDGHINVDFADVKTVMTNSGVALMGSGEAEGENRAEDAVKSALNSPLLNNNDIVGAKDILLNITSGTKYATMDEIGYINEFVQEASGNNADLIWGASTDETLGEKIKITIIATGFATKDIPEIYSFQNIQTTDDKKLEYIDQNKDIPFIIQKPVENEDKKFKLNDTKEDIYKNSFLDSDLDFKENVGSNSISLKRIPENPKELYAIENETSVVYKNELENDNFTQLKQKTTTVITKQISSSDFYKNVDEYESTPAYLRNKILTDLNKKTDPKEISRYTLTGSGSDTKVSENNPYLHDNVD